mgnify:CR=1 FL=1
MTIRTLTALLLFLTLSVGAAQYYTFADLEFGSSPAEVQEALEARGYEHVHDQERLAAFASYFAGRMLDHPILVVARFDSRDRLDVVSVHFVISGLDRAQRDTTAILISNRLLNALTDRYGDPSQSRPLDYPYGRLTDSDEDPAAFRWKAREAGWGQSLNLIVKTWDTRDQNYVDSLFRHGAPPSEADIWITIYYGCDPNSRARNQGIDDL